MRPGNRIRFGMPEGNTAPDEPMFILFARDACAAPLVEALADISERRGTNPEKVAEARECATAMRAWRKRNTSRLVDLRSAASAKQGPEAGEWAKNVDLSSATRSDLIEFLGSFARDVRQQTISEMRGAIEAETEKISDSFTADVIDLAVDAAAAAVAAKGCGHGS